MKKPSLFSMLVLSLAVHGVLLAGGWMAVKCLFRTDVGEQVMAVITADYYGTEKKHEAPQPPAPTRDPAEVEKPEPVKKARKKPFLPGPSADESGAAAADSPIQSGPEFEAPEGEAAAQVHELQEGKAPAEKQPSGPAKAETKGLSEEKTVSLIHAAVKKAVVYPHMARKHGMEGIVRVSFSVSPGGWPSKIRVEKSSGFDILDEAAIQAVKKGKPYPAIAKAVEVPIRFSLKE